MGLAQTAAQAGQAVDRSVRSVSRCLAGWGQRPAPGGTAPPVLARIRKDHARDALEAPFGNRVERFERRDPMPEREIDRPPGGSQWNGASVWCVQSGRDAHPRKVSINVPSERRRRPRPAPRCLEQVAQLAVAPARRHARRRRDAPTKIVGRAARVVAVVPVLVLRTKVPAWERARAKRLLWIRARRRVGRSAAARLGSVARARDGGTPLRSAPSCRGGDKRGASLRIRLLRMPRGPRGRAHTC